MKQPIVKLAFSALLGAAIAGSALTGAAHAQSAGQLAAPQIVPLAQTATVEAEQVNHRWRRHYRHHRRHHDRGGGIYFDFGNGSFSLTVPPRRYDNRRYYSYPRSSASAHVRWCYARYKSYRHWDNTFQPYHGPRRQCFSPYN
ncbi:MAG: BA14K family protein [Rhizobiaceae bacterium]|nr:BA14K family protein [Rhizobiaceae bacterium]